MPRTPTSAIACPTCGSPASHVVDSRGVRASDYIRRRRVCESGHRFSTVETAVRETQKPQDAASIVRRIRFLVAELEEKLGGLT